MHAQEGEHEHDYDGDENCIHANSGYCIVSAGQ